MNRSSSLTRSPLLVKNTLLNLLGYGSPLVVAVFSIPKIVAGMGTDRFGILTLAWVLIGYFGLLDLGLGRALTLVVAEKLGADQTTDIPGTIWTALFAMLLVAITLGTTVIVCNHWMVYDILKIPIHLQTETYRAFFLLAAFLPVVVVSVGFRGILEAYQRFDLVNIVRIPLGIFSFAAPLAVIPFSVNLTTVILVLCIGRMAAAGVQFLFCCRIIPGLIGAFSIETRQFRMLMKFGGWMTVTNIISPLMVYVDRLFIGAMVSITAVTFYATPSEVITKLTLVSGALMSVLFPAISSSFRVDRQRSAHLLEQGLKTIFFGLFPIVLSIVAFAPEGLAFWLGDHFRQNSTGVTRILAGGIFFCCLGQIPYAFIQGAGRPDLTGKLHLIEFPLYVVLLTGSIVWAGITGAALVWSIRFIIDSLVMFLIARKLVGQYQSRMKVHAAAGVAALAALIVISQLPSVQWRAAGCLLIVAIFIWTGCRYALSSDEKRFIKKQLQILKKNGDHHRA